MKARTLLYNARVHTQANGIVADSIAIYKSRIIAVGNRLEHDPDFDRYDKTNLKGRMVIPGFVDAHTHFYYFALSLGRVNLHGLQTLDACLQAVDAFSTGLKRSAWVVGDGYSPDRFRVRIEPDRHQLDAVTHGHPAFIFSKDQHSAWVNSRALEIAGIDKNSADPAGGEIVRYADGMPTGILREQPGYIPVFRAIVPPARSEVNRLYRQALEYTYAKGVTGVHSMDGPDGLDYFSEIAATGKLGLRVNYYVPVEMLPKLRKHGLGYGAGDDYLRLAGVKIFSDGSLGSQTALCFHRYRGSRDKRGIEVTSVKELKKITKSAARLGLPCAIHAIGDKAVANVLDALEQCPVLPAGRRHRIEHLQLVRRKDIQRLKRLAVVASMQPSHCPSDINMMREYWGQRSANAFIFRTLLDRGIDLAFGSDLPIEPLDPIAGIAAAVRRAGPRSRDVFHPEQRITATEALYGFTAGPAVACGQADRRGYLLPGYPADVAILDQDLTRVPPTRVEDTQVLATMLDGKLKYCDSSLRL